MTPQHAPIIAAWLRDLRNAVDAAQAPPAASIADRLTAEAIEAAIERRRKKAQA